MILGNDLIEVSFDDQCGALRSIVYRPTNQQLLSNDLNEAFNLEKDQDEYVSVFDTFQHECFEDSIRLKWQIGGVVIHATVTLKGESVCFRSNVDNQTEWQLHSLAYPLIDGITVFGDGLHHVVHPFATGLIIDNPLVQFQLEGDGYRHMPYPESFSGASMQFFGYYEEDSVGILFAAYDEGYHQKWLNFYRHNDKLRASQVYGYEDVGAGKGLNGGWDFELTVITESRWECYAERYREWALKAPWCQKGRLFDLHADRAAKWLIEKTAAVTFGINAKHDRIKWLQQYHDDIEGSIFHILGPDWTKVEQDFFQSLPGGFADWFPTRFHQGNIDCIKKQQDHFAPFTFDFLVHTERADSDMIQDNLQLWPQKPKSIDRYLFNMLCPLTPYTQELHRTRDEQVLDESGCNAMYYDISANNIIKTCMSEEHGHAVGAGQAMTQAYRKIYQETKNALAQKAGEYIPLGTEMINETLIDVLDYYQARANAQPNSALETWPFRKLMRQGSARLIPLFNYVYSEYAPVRCDGWGKMTNETGDIIYHTIAKTYLWSGLFEINAEYSELERINGISNDSSEHYYPFQPEGFSYQQIIARFVGKCARLRTGRFGKALIYGRMLRMTDIKCRKIYRTYYQYNHGVKSHEQHDHGIILLDAVLAQGYAFQDEVAFYIVNSSLFAEKAEMSLPEGLCNTRSILVRSFGEADEVETEIMTGSTITLGFKPLEAVILHTFPKGGY